MKVEIDQIWERDYADDYHYFPVRVKIISVDFEKIISEVVYSSISERPKGMLLKAILNGEDPFEYKKKSGWVHLNVKEEFVTEILKLVKNYKEKYGY